MAYSNLDVVILCGGRGTRLAGMLPLGTPKAMASIDGKPFLQILLQHFIWSGFRRFIFCLGRDAERIKMTNRTTDFRRPEFIFSTEDFLKGTGGALRLAGPHIKTDPFFIVNGDTYCEMDYEVLFAAHKGNEAIATIGIDDHHRHVGVSLWSKRIFGIIADIPHPFGLEDVMTSLGARHEPVNFVRVDQPFYDIGSPEGLEKFREYWRERKSSGR